MVGMQQLPEVVSQSQKLSEGSAGAFAIFILIGLAIVVMIFCRNLPAKGVSLIEARIEESNAARDAHPKIVAAIEKLADNFARLITAMHTDVKDVQAKIDRVLLRPTRRPPRRRRTRRATR